MAQDEVVLDLTNYKDRVGSRVVPGRYRVRVSDAELDKTREGKAMINVWLDVVGGEFEGGTVIDRLLPEHPKALFRVVGFLQAIGQATPKKRLKINVASFVGKQLDVDIEDGEPYNGRVKSEIRGYYRIEKGSEVAGPTDLDDLEPVDPLDYPEDVEPEPEPDEPVRESKAAAALKEATVAASTPAAAKPSVKEQLAARQAKAQAAAAEAARLAAEAEALSAEDVDDAERAIAGDPADDDQDGFPEVDLESLELD